MWNNRHILKRGEKNNQIPDDRRNDSGPSDSGGLLKQNLMAQTWPLLPSAPSSQHIHSLVLTERKPHLLLLSLLFLLLLFLEIRHCQISQGDELNEKSTHSNYFSNPEIFVWLCHKTVITMLKSHKNRLLKIVSLDTFERLSPIILVFGISLSFFAPFYEIKFIRRHACIFIKVVRKITFYRLEDLGVLEMQYVMEEK